MTQPLTARDAHPRRENMAHMGRIGMRMLAAVAIIGGSLAVAGLPDNTSALAAEPSCANGVTVVVDFTDLGGKIDVACAQGDQATGRAALLAAGFTGTDSQPGFLCAINSMPDPCPTTFAGSFWSYWHSTPSGEWTSYQVGADSSKPAPGELEGWRYNDGTKPPGITPAAAATSTTPEPQPTATASANPSAPTTDQSVTTTQTPGQEVEASQNSAITFTTIGFLVVIIGLVVLFVVRSRRRRLGAGDPDAGDPDAGDQGAGGTDSPSAESHNPDSHNPDSHHPESHN